LIWLRILSLLITMSNMRRSLSLKVLFYLLPCLGFAQPFSQRESLSQLSIFQWTGENGLVSNNITSAIQAKSGFVWITTYNGIMRFDGISVEVYDRNTLPFLQTDAFYKVYEDKQETLWFASQGSGIIKYTNGKFEPFLSKELPKSIRCLFIEEDGDFWVGTNNQGLYHVTKNGVTKIDDPLLNDVTVMDIKRQKNILWVATHGGGLIKIQNNTFSKLTVADGLASDGINTLHVTPDGTLFAGTTSGLNEIKGGNIMAHSWVSGQAHYIASDNKNRIWIGTENGLGRVDPSNNTQEFITEKDGLNIGRVNFVSFGIEGTLWISTERNGLIMAKETGILNISTYQGLTMNRVNVITEAANGVFYIGTDGGHINVYSHGSIQKIRTKTPLSDIRDICVDLSGQLWIATYQGVLKISGNQEKLLTEKDGLPASDIRRILLDSRGNLWFASRSAGIVKMKDNRVEARYHTNQGLSSNYILALEEDSDGNIYVGTHSGGLTIIKPDGDLNTYNLSQDNSGILIFNVHVSSNGSVWLVCNTGLFNFDGNKFKPIKMDRTNKGETYFDWVEDKAGNVWVTSNVGVIKINQADIQKYLQGETDRLPTRLIDNQDGMKNKECTGAAHSLLSATGKLWIPTIGGISVIYPDKIQNNTTAPKVYINRLVTDTKSFIDSVVVQPGNLRYVFNYTAISFVSPSKIKFRYKLNSIDPEWVDAGTKRSVEYTNLPPGAYTFSVMASNNNTDWSPQADMHVSILPFFYQTIWFYILCTLLILLLFYSIYRWRLYVVEKSNKELRKVNSELDRFVYSASHDLRAPLASILGLVSVARLDPKGDMQDYLSKIEVSIQRLDGFIHDIIDFSRNARTELDASKIDFQQVVSEVFEDLKYLDEKNNIKQTVEIQATDEFFSDKKRLVIILRNLISNSIKYQNSKIPDPYIKVSVNISSSVAVLRVSDNGMGIGEDHLEKVFRMFYRGHQANKGSGLGLYIVKETVEKIRGTIKVTSIIDQGTTFTLTLPNLKPTA
jgi:signal transduction histidine kinase/ligand-binding sensor domain-containing protein